jgi:ubiquitin C-terminal hydrolase
MILFLQTEKHRTGLKNLGNTCYMNSIVQCLIHIPGLVHYFQSEKWKEHLYLHKRQKSSTNGDVSLEFHAVVQEMNVGHRSIAIIDFRVILIFKNNSVLSSFSVILYVQIIFRILLEDIIVHSEDMSNKTLMNFSQYYWTGCTKN